MAIVKLETGEELEFDNQYSDEQISQAVEEYLAQKQPQQPIQELKQESSTFMNIARGLPVGLGRAFVGGIQAATDVGESAARGLESLIYGDEPLQKETFGSRLAGQVQKQNQQLAQEPLSTRVGVGIGEALPYLTSGAGTGAKVAQAVGGAKGAIAGLGTAGAIGGATQQGLGAQEEAGLGNRLGQAAKGGATGAAFGVGLGALGEGGKALARGTTDFVKQIYKGYKAIPLDDLPVIADDIAAGSSALYNQAEEAGAVFKPDAVGALLGQIDNAVKEGGTLFKTNHPKTFSLLKEIRQDVVANTKAGKPISLPQLDQYRRALSTAANESLTPLGKMTDDGRRLAGAVKTIDNFLTQNPPEKILASGNPDAINLYKTAQKEWQRYSQFSDIANLVKKADGDPNRLKTLVGNFVNDARKVKGYKPEVINSLKKASQNSNPEALSKALGKFGFDLGSGRNIGNTIVPGASILYGGAKGSATAAAGTVARQVQKLAAQGKIQETLDIIQGLKPLEQEKVIKAIPVNIRNTVMLNLLNKSSSGKSDDAYATEDNIDITKNGF